ncbi:Spx/MgsR family RNA polymerase-binding regulatory protein [Texas Phoenix palm phytoplasma]|uniref:Spx/MgsR family RNA polymerase-binding regulatory protein n=1 Tax=Texas Phoenix palm phytoplasma TaxID=176709 RepID=A0ABS5BIT6_9MOLU|nr:Spx/MgsR family RNA polymerase-binding regulatory protein [Texas Phoenix palm phytoplasma]MBP3059491.1 Spx/MgsR family RNA polymerase-binding regulatory protein [Texas Phoenix palm phytoplasma]
MVLIYTNARCVSCKKAKKWLEIHGVKYKEKNLNKFNLKESDIDSILDHEQIDFTNIISTRSRIFKQQKFDLFSLKIKQIKRFIIENPSICKKPIIYDKNSIVIGYNQDDIRVFIPKNLRHYIIRNNIHIKKHNYVQMIKEYFSKINK